MMVPANKPVQPDLPALAPAWITMANGCRRPTRSFDIRIMNDLTIEVVKSQADATELDTLLWKVLWMPLGLPRNVRESFKLGGECLEFVAKSDGEVVGGLVANWTSPTGVELRHIAVKAEAQYRGVGSQLVKALMGKVAQNGCTRIHTIARNTSTGFFKKLGFTAAPGDVPEHPVFMKHGITFELLERNVEQGAAADADKPRR